MKPDVMKLKTLASADPIARAFFALAAERERGRQDTNLRRLRRLMREAGTPATTAQLAELFSKLEAAGIGKVIYGRGNKPTRFVWDYNLKSVAQAVNDTGKVAKQAPAKHKLPMLNYTAGFPAPKPEAPQPASDAAAPKTNGKAHTIIIRRAGVTIKAPASMTPEERESVLAFVNELPSARR